MDCVDPYDSDSACSEVPDSFGELQLSAAEAEGESVPALEGLCITGEPRPGCLLTLEGRAVGGAVQCCYAWVRCFEGGSSSYIEGEKKATYLVTADDVDAFLAIEVIPIGEDGRMGEMITKYANGHRKISCDLEMYEQIEKSFLLGHASFSVSVLVNRRNGWEKAELEITRNGFCITRSNSISVIEKFSPRTAVGIHRDGSTGFLLQQGDEPIRLSAETSLSRDVIVLTMRLFIRRANEKNSPSSVKKRRKRFLFF